MIPGAWLDAGLDVLLSPGLWLSVFLVLIYVLLLSVWRWGGWPQLGRDMLAGLLGFAVGQLIGTFSGINWLRIGQVHLLLGTVGAVIALAVGRMIRRSAGSG